MTSSSPAQGENWRRLCVLWDRDWLKGFLLVVAVFFAYQPALHGKFIWDDESWTSNISSLLKNSSGLRLMWCQPTALQQYSPLTGTTFWLDYQLWGFWTLPYHIENVLLHSFGALLFWRLLRRLQVPGAWLAGAIFALHPVNTESVAWITERKNVLSLPLYLGALMAYGRFTRFWKAETDSASAIDNSLPQHRGAYALSFFLFLAALLAKSTAFSLPAAILLICWWKRGRIQWRTDVLPTLPFFVLAVGFSLLTSWLEKHHLGAMGTDWSHPFSERCLIAGRALWFYAGKLFFPANLMFIYPRWQLDASAWWQWIFPIAALAVVAALWCLRQRISRGPLVAVLFFSGTLFPVLGFMNVYFMRYSFVCDHWVYLSSLGLITLGTSVIVQIVERLRLPMIFRGFASVLLLVLAILTWRQSRMYADAETLWRTTLDRNPACWLASESLGDILLKKGMVNEAMAQLQQTLAIQPDDAVAYDNIGIALLQKGQVNEAITNYQRALAIQPDYALAHYNLGDVLFQKGRVDEAIVQLQQALAIQPEFAEAHNNLGNILLQRGETDEAIVHFQRALAIQPDYAAAHYDLGNALFLKGQTDEAIIHYQRALAIQPDHAKAHNNLGTALLQKGQLDEAINEFQKALAIQPSLVEAQIGLAHIAWVLATSPDPSIRNGTKAVELAEQTNRLSGGNNPIIAATLAAAYAEAGRFPEAITTAQRAEQLATSQNNTALAAPLEAELKLYQAGSPLHETGTSR
jgi:tetratricopeptide (TPR) repeat protein